MTRAGVRILLLLCSFLALAAGGVGIARPIAVPRPLPKVPTVGASPAVSVPNIDSLVRTVIASAPFRAGRVLASVRYDPHPVTPDTVPHITMLPPRPALALFGMVWGSQPAAVVEGFPGTTGPRVVYAGEQVGALTVQRIDASGITITGLDTVWNLTVRMPWH